MRVLVLPLFLLHRTNGFCPYMSQNSNDELERSRSLWNTNQYEQKCTNNCFINDGGDLVPRSYDEGDDKTTFEVMADLSASADGADMCIFSFQELNLPSDDDDDGGRRRLMDASLLLEMVSLGDSASTKLNSIASAYPSAVKLAACTMGSIPSQTACAYAKANVDGFNYHQSDDDDDGKGNPTYYSERFCKSEMQYSAIEQPQAITIFRITEDTADAVAELLYDWRNNGHAENIYWAYTNGIGAGGHLLAKIVECDQISSKFMNPSYSSLSQQTNYFCDYVEDGSSVTFAEEALAEWESLCSIWPADDSAVKCRTTTSSSTNVASWLSSSSETSSSYGFSFFIVVVGILLVSGWAAYNRYYVKPGIEITEGTLKQDALIPTSVVNGGIHA